MYKKCPNCEESKFQILEDHIWIRIDQLTGTVEEDHLYIKKCINCGHSEDDVQERKNLILKLIDTEFIHYNYFEGIPPEILEKDILFQIAKLYYFIIEKNFQNAYTSINHILEELNKTGYSNRNKYNLKFIEIICLYLFDRNNFEKNLESIAHLLESDNITYNFIYDLLLLSSKNNVNGKQFDIFKEKYFPNFLPLYQAFNMQLSLINVTEDPIRIWLDSCLNSTFIFEKLISPLIENVFNLKINFEKWPNDEIVFLEQIEKSIIPEKIYKYKKGLKGHIEKPDVEINENGNPIWYKLIKSIHNQLAFDVLCFQDKINDAFTYFEIKSINYIRPRNSSYDNFEEDDFFEISEDSFPTNFDKEEWLNSEDVHEATWHCYYAEVWAEVLKYLTVVHFYELQISDKNKKEFHNKIEERILHITNEYLNNKMLKKEKLNWKIPLIVGNIYEKREQWDNAIEYYKIANVNDNEKQALILKCKNQRGDDIDRLLIDEIKNLTIDEQRQILAFARIIVITESKIKDFIRNIFSKNGVKLSDVIASTIGKKELDNRKKSSILSISSLPVKDDLDWFTFPELIDLMMNDKYWQFFKKIFQYKNILITFKTEITPIRNNIAHAKPISKLQLDYALDKTNQLLKLI